MILPLSTVEAKMSTFEFTLRCNSLKCRKEISGLAVVTTCSHIYCTDCANNLQLFGVRDGQRPICTACDGQLSNPEDVVGVNLNPSEDYKSCVLSGLSPSVILECASRALNFWAYQTNSEITYQEYLAKNLTDKYTMLNSQVDKVVHDANSEISNLRNNISSRLPLTILAALLMYVTYMEADQDSLRRKVEELNLALREKNRKYLQTQELYDKLKRRAMLGQVQDAASDEVDNAIQASVSANRFVDKVGNQTMRPPPPPPLFSGQQNTGVHRTGASGTSGMNAAQMARGGDSGWAGFSSQASNNQNLSVQTPSSSRQRLASYPMLGLGLGLQSNAVSATPQTQSRVSPRQPLGSINGNNPGLSGFAGYGMSAGLKVSNPTGPTTNGLPRPVMRSRVAQRNASGGFPTNQSSTYRSSSTTNMFSNGNNLY
ncbi:hypothetical protein ONS95_010991 [Cadophora gregata]|uniref:uncharacterized protein n=1 Tax=Cadophora gregata TaxID=51156 RepID=UPI0026DC4CD5|nr:uncharacterized protein ONS95_010991 [Cadophora gregata]KAK0119551.1 hypothetical protein ONS95_010991 [Cadophora gregata]KAK0120589.1 hypothetical protein ONS96_010793 [Cadophora gregata f. sp. sojae]